MIRPTLALLLCLIVTLSGSISAIDHRPLPAALTFTSLDGKQIKSDTLPDKGNWMLVYVKDRCHLCDHMLRQFETDQYSSLLGRAIIVVEGPPDVAKGLQLRHPGLTNVRWLSDPQRNAFSLLNLHGIPALIGLNEHTIHWKFYGVPQNSGTFHSLVAGWVQQSKGAR